jgi:hypothetical protein
MTEKPWFDSWQKQETYLFSIASRPALVPSELSVQWVQGAVSMGKKLKGCEADISPPSSIEAKNDGGISSLPHSSS